MSCFMVIQVRSCYNMAVLLGKPEDSEIGLGMMVLTGLYDRYSKTG